MLHYFKLRQELFDPSPAQDLYRKPGKGKGWPEECPPIRAANSFGFDLLANFDISFIHTRSSDRPWKIEPDVVIQSDFDFHHNEESPGSPLTQQYAWFWEKSQKLPHPISDNVYDEIKHQVKISTFLFFKTDPNELLLFQPIPNLARPFKAMSALVDSDWYPASYPWHLVIELDRNQKRIEIKKGTPLSRLMIVKRDTYFARQMSPDAFSEFFDRGQTWLTRHGRPHESADAPHHLDITRTYHRQQIRSRFIVID